MLFQKYEIIITLRHKHQLLTVYRILCFIHNMNK